MSKLADRTIIEYIQSGNKDLQNQAFRFLYREYYGLIESLVTTNNGKQEDCPDLFQDVIVVFFNKVKQQDFEATSTLKTFLYAIARNLWLLKLRKNKTQNLALEDKHEFIPSDENYFENIEMTEKTNLLVQLIQKMGVECKKVLEAYYYRKMKMAQIRQLFNLSSEQAAKNKKSRCMKKLREMVMANTAYQTILR